MKNGGVGFRVLFAVGGLFVVFAGYWAVMHADSTPRVSAGLGSSLSPQARKVSGALVLAVGVLIVVAGVTGIAAPPS